MTGFSAGNFLGQITIGVVIGVLLIIVIAVIVYCARKRRKAASGDGRSFVNM